MFILMERDHMSSKRLPFLLSDSALSQVFSSDEGSSLPCTRIAVPALRGVTPAAWVCTCQLQATWPWHWLRSHALLDSRVHHSKAFDLNQCSPVRKADVLLLLACTVGVMRAATGIVNAAMMQRYANKIGFCYGCAQVRPPVTRYSPTSKSIRFSESTQSGASCQIWLAWVQSIPLIFPESEHRNQLLLSPMGYEQQILDKASRPQDDIVLALELQGCHCSIERTACNWHCISVVDCTLVIVQAQVLS